MDSKTQQDTNSRNDLAAEKPIPGSGNPALPIASLIFAALGLLLGLEVSWILSVLAGIVAIVVGIISRKQRSPRLALANLGIAVGVIDIVSSLALVGYALYSIMQLGIA